MKNLKLKTVLMTAVLTLAAPTMAKADQAARAAECKKLSIAVEQELKGVVLTEEIQKDIRNQAKAVGVGVRIALVNSPMTADFSTSRLTIVLTKENTIEYHGCF